MARAVADATGQGAAAEFPARARDDGATPWSRRRALASLLHPVPSLATVAVALGFTFLLAGRSVARGPLLLLAAMLLCQQFAISVHNDWCDRSLDAATKPWRAIPAGAIAAHAAFGAAWLLAAVSLACALPLGAAEVALDAVGIGAGFAYNARLKATRLSWLPFAVAFPLLPLFGAAAFGAWPRGGWSLFVIGLPCVLAIHLADTLPDVASDAAHGLAGLAHSLGATGARRVSLGALLAAGVLATAFAALGGTVVPLAGALVAAVTAGLALVRPHTHRLAVTSGAAAVGLAWVAAMAR